jgi:hypothetical protein
MSSEGGSKKNTTFRHPMNKHCRNAIKILCFLPEEKRDGLNNASNRDGRPDLFPIDRLWTIICLVLAVALLGLALL